MLIIYSINYNSICEPYIVFVSLESWTFSILQDPVLGTSYFGLYCVLVIFFIHPSPFGSEVWWNPTIPVKNTLQGISSSSSCFLLDHKSSTLLMRYRMTSEKREYSCKVAYLRRISFVLALCEEAPLCVRSVKYFRLLLVTLMELRVKEWQTCMQHVSEQSVWKSWLEVMR